MELLTSLEQLQAFNQQRSPQQTVGFVPTMGYLHAGHLSLVKAANQQCDLTLVSIFVNPSQFGPNEDLSAYPRDLDRDLAMLAEYKVDYVFFPDVQMMYPPGYKTWITVQELTDTFCGASRPGHFTGVATVVLKLVNLVRPHLMFMGEKDYQQIVILETMLRDLNLPARIVRCPIVREPDGLAMSSRNAYLSETERSQALCLYNALSLARMLYTAGERNITILKAQMTALIEQSGGKPDYIAFVDKDTLEEVESPADNTRILLAVHIGRTRLIDNASICDNYR